MVDPEWAAQYDAAIRERKLAGEQLQAAYLILEGSELRCKYAQENLTRILQTKIHLREPQ